MENCKLCKFETNTKLKLSKHIYREHGLIWEDDINNNLKKVKQKPSENLDI